MKLRVLMGLVGLTALVFMFQNCGQVQFLKADSSGGLVAANTDGTGNLPNEPSTPVVEPIRPEIDPGRAPETSASEPSETTCDSKEPKDSKDPKDSKEPKDPKNQEQPERPEQPKDSKSPEQSKSPSEPVAQASAQSYQCIIKNHGKSTHVQYSADALSSGTGMKQTVCMSENACLNIASQIFEVVGVNHSEPCAHNPNVVQMSDTDVAALVTAQKPR